MLDLDSIINHGDPMHQTREDAIAIIRDNQKANDNATFVWAAKYGLVCVLEYLMSLPAEARINPFNNNFMALLHAAEHGCLPVVQYLVSLSPAPNQHIIQYYAQAVCLAVKNGHTDVVNHFVSLPKELGIPFDAYDYCALRYALLYDHLNIFNIMLKALEDRGFSYETMIHVAIKNSVKYGDFGLAHGFLNAAYPDRTEANNLFSIGMIDALIKTKIHSVTSHYRSSRSPIDKYNQVQNALNFVLFLDQILKDGLIEPSQQDELNQMMQEIKQLTKRAYIEEAKHRPQMVTLLFSDIFGLRQNIEQDMVREVLKRADHAVHRS